MSKTYFQRTASHSYCLHNSEEVQKERSYLTIAVLTLESASQSPGRLIASWVAGVSDLGDPG